MAKNTNTAGSFDIAALKPEAAELPKVARDAKPNPFSDWLADSYAEWTEDHDKGGRKVTVPASNATEVKNLIRRASDALGIGSRVIVLKSDGKPLGKDEKMPTTGNVTVLYCGRDRKVRKDAAGA